MGNEKENPVEKFREKYDNCLEGVIEDKDFPETGDTENRIRHLSIRQAVVSKTKPSKAKLALLQVDTDLNIPQIALTRGHKVSFVAIKGYIGEGDYDETLVAIVNHESGRTYETGFGEGVRSLDWNDFNDNYRID